MFKEMRRIEKQLHINRTEDILNNGEYGILSTIGKNGYPYGVAGEKYINNLKNNTMIIKINIDHMIER